MPKKPEADGLDNNDLPPKSTNDETNLENIEKTSTASTNPTVATTPGATCECGYTRGNRFIQADYSYNTVGIFGLLTFGFTAVPSRVDWKCVICKKILETITDPAELKRYRYRPPLTPKTPQSPEEEKK